MEPEGLIEPIATEAADSAAESPVEQAPRRSTRVRTELERYGFIVDSEKYNSKKRMMSLKAIKKF